MKCIGKESLAKLVLIPFLGLGLTSCIRIAEKLATDLADRSVRRSHTFNLVKGDLARYRQCLKTRGGACQLGSGSAPRPISGSSDPTQVAAGPALKQSLNQLPESHPARNAASALESPLLDCTALLHDHIAGRSTRSNSDCRVSQHGQDSTIHLNVSISATQRLADDVHEATASGGWDALAQHAGNHLATLTVGTPQHNEVRKDHHKFVYIREYIRAYFRNGRFIGVQFQLDQTKAIADLTSELDKHSSLECQAFNAARAAAQDPAAVSGTLESSSDCQALATEIYRAALGSGNLGEGNPITLLSVKDVGFKPRGGGLGAQFPEIDINIDPLDSPVVSFDRGGSSSRINFTAVGSELIGVVLEAVFDAHEGLPALKGATGLSFPQAEKAFELPLFQPVANGSPGVDANDFDEMRRINQGAGAAAGVIIDRVIRGIGPLSLNNEAIEELITQIVASAVRKAMEKATWCFYSCDINVDIEKARQAIATSLDKAGQKLTGALASYDHDATENVKLALTTSK